MVAGGRRWSPRPGPARIAPPHGRFQGPAEHGNRTGCWNPVRRAIRNRGVIKFYFPLLFLNIFRPSRNAISRGPPERHRPTLRSYRCCKAAACIPNPKNLSLRVRLMLSRIKIVCAGPRGHSIHRKNRATSSGGKWSPSGRRVVAGGRPPKTELCTNFSSWEPPIYSGAYHNLSRQTTKFESHRVPEPRAAAPAVRGHFELAAL